MGLKITSVLVISMLLCSRHNAAVLDELSCCPSVGDWVSLGGWVAGRAQMKDMFSSHLGTGGLTGWLLATWSTARSQQKPNNCITLINLLWGIKKGGRDLFFTLYFYTLADSFVQKDPWSMTYHSAASCSCHKKTRKWVTVILERQKTSLWPFTVSL